MDCSDITCLTCPDDSITIFETSPAINTDTPDQDDTSSENLLKNAVSVPISGNNSPTDDTANHELIISGKTKRAIKPSRRETIKIVPGGREFFERKRRSIVIPSINYEFVNEQKIFECCSRRRCHCDETRCQQMRPECAVNEVLIVVRNATKSPGDCCSEYRCGSEPECHLKKETYGGIRLKLKGRTRQGMFYVC